MMGLTKGRLALCVLAFVAFVGTWTLLPYAVGMSEDWRATALMLGSLLAWIAYSRAMGWIFHRQRLDDRLAAVRESIEATFAERGDVVPGSGTGRLHECWRRSGRSWSFMPETGWIDGPRGSCAEIHDDDGQCGYVQAALRDEDD